MERFKINKDDIPAVIEKIFDNSLGNIILLSSAPTERSHMNANTLGYFNGELFIRLGNGEIKKITLTSVV